MKARVLRTNQIIEVEYLGKLGKFSKIFRDIQSGIEYTEKDIVFCFDFNSSVCTDRHQSERLLALGLRKETADCVLPKKDNLSPLVMPYDMASIYTTLEIIPAWSLHRLLCFLPKHIQVYDEVWKFKRNLYLSIDEDFNIRYEENIDEPCFDKTFWAYDIYQNCIDAIEWLIKEGYFNKEYLV